MRRFDKKKNMGKANLLAEQRYLESKGLIKEDELGEYDYSGFKNKYSGMDTERMDNLVSKGKERQVRDGIKLIPTRNSEFELYVLPSDINFSQPDLSELKNRRNEIKLTFNFYIDNGVLKGKDSTNTIDINGSINAILRPLNDKEKPPYSLDVQNIRLTNNGFDGVFTPADRKGGMKLINAIKEMLIKEYGKFDMKKPLFIPGENIKAHPNAFIKEEGVKPEIFHEADETPVETPEELVRSWINSWTTQYKDGVPGIDAIDYDISGENFSDYELNLLYSLNEEGTMELNYTVTFTITQTGSPRRATLEEPEEYLEWEVEDIDIKDIEFKDMRNEKTYTNINNDLYNLLYKNAEVTLKELENHNTIPNFVDDRY